MDWRQVDLLPGNRSQLGQDGLDIDRVFGGGVVDVVDQLCAQGLHRTDQRIEVRLSVVVVVVQGSDRLDRRVCSLDLRRTRLDQLGERLANGRLVEPVGELAELVLDGGEVDGLGPELVEPLVQRVDAVAERREIRAAVAEVGAEIGDGGRDRAQIDGLRSRGVDLFGEGVETSVDRGEIRPRPVDAFGEDLDGGRGRGRERPPLVDLRRDGVDDLGQRLLHRCQVDGLGTVCLDAVAQRVEPLVDGIDVDA